MMQSFIFRTEVAMDKATGRKISVLLTLLACLTASLLALDDGSTSMAPDISLQNSFNDAFEDFKRDYKKVYASEVEERRARLAFNANLAKIQAQNKLYANGEITYYLGINKYADQKPSRAFTSKYYENKLFEGQLFGESSVELPASHDYTTEGVVSPVEEQGNCFISWAFATTGVIESYNAMQTGNLLKLSKKQLEDCSGNDDPCNGGDVASALVYVKANKGLALEADYPYEPGDDKSVCRTEVQTPEQLKLKLKGTGYIQIKQGDYNAMLIAVATIGPVTAAIHFVSSGFQYYEGGVFYATDCDPSLANHHLLIVGYGVDAKTNLPYWKARNSWGTSWGEGGYIRIRRGVNTCGIENFVFYPDVDSTTSSATTPTTSGTSTTSSTTSSTTTTTPTTTTTSTPTTTTPTTTTSTPTTTTTSTPTTTTSTSTTSTRTTTTSSPTPSTTTTSTSTTSTPRTTTTSTPTTTTPTTTTSTTTTSTRTTTTSSPTPSTTTTSTSTTSTPRTTTTTSTTTTPRTTTTTTTPRTTTTTTTPRTTTTTTTVTTTTTSTKQPDPQFELQTFGDPDLKATSDVVVFAMSSVVRQFAAKQARSLTAKAIANDLEVRYGRRWRVIIGTLYSFSGDYESSNYIVLKQINTSPAVYITMSQVPDCGIDCNVNLGSNYNTLLLGPFTNWDGDAGLDFQTSQTMTNYASLSTVYLNGNTTDMAKYISDNLKKLTSCEIDVIVGTDYDVYFKYRIPKYLSLKQNNLVIKMYTPDCIPFKATV